MSTTPGRRPSSDWVLDESVSQLIHHKARKLSRSRGFSRSDQPDIEQEFRLHLLLKAAKYDVARANPLTFAQRVIENKARSMFRKVAAGKRSYRLNSCSLNEPVAQPDGGISDLSELFDTSAGRRHTGQRTQCASEVASLKLDLAETNQCLPATQKRLVALLSHVPEFTASEVLGLSRKKAARYVAQVRELYASRGLAG